MTNTHAYYINAIVNRLLWLCDYTKLNVKNHLFDILVRSEDFYCGLLNIVYNMEFEVVDYHALPIDLVDNNVSIAIEIKLNSSLSSIIRVCENFKKNGLDHRYKKLIIFDLALEKKHYRKDIFERRYLQFFDPDTDIKSVNDIIYDLSKLSTSKLENVYQYVINSPIFREYVNKAEDIAPKVLNYEEPKEPVLIERELTVYEIKKLLNDYNILVLTGPAGIGKTAVASYLFHQLKTEVDHLGWITSTGDLRKDLLQLNLYKDFKSETLRYSLIINWFSKTDTPVCVFIDEITDRLSEDEELILDSFSDKVKIIITSRLKDITSNLSVCIKEIEPLDNNQSKQLFDLHYKGFLNNQYREEEYEALSQLAGNPALIELYSKLLNSNSVDGDELKALKELINKIKSGNEINQDRPKVFSNEERKILCLFLILPAGLEIWSEYMNWAGVDKNTLSHISAMGIIQYKEPNYVMLEPIKELLMSYFGLKQDLKIDFDDYGQLLSKLSETEKYLGDDQSDISIENRIRVPKAICNLVIENEIFDSDIAELLINIANKLEDLNDLEEAMKYYEFCLTQCVNNSNKLDFRTIKALLGTARIHNAYADYDSVQKIIARIEDEIGKEGMGQRRFAEVRYEMARIYVDQNEIEKGIKYFNESVDIIKAFLNTKSERVFTSKVLFAYADALVIEGRYCDALKLYKEAHSIHKQAACLNSIALCYHEMKEYQDALFHYLEAYKMAFKAYGVSHEATNIIRNNLTCLIKTAGELVSLEYREYEIELCDFDFSECVLTNAYLRLVTIKKSNFFRTDFHKADLRGADLRGSSFIESNLKMASLRKANLEGVNFEGADLEGADLEGANLRKANLRRTNLKGAKLREAKFEGANLKGADLEGANFERANFNGIYVNYDNVNYLKRFDIDTSKMIVTDNTSDESLL